MKLILKSGQSDSATVLWCNHGYLIPICPSLLSSILSFSIRSRDNEIIIRNKYDMQKMFFTKFRNGWKSIFSCIFLFYFILLVVDQVAIVSPILLLFLLHVAVVSAVVVVVVAVSADAAVVVVVTVSVVAAGCCCYCYCCCFKLLLKFFIYSRISAAVFTQCFWLWCMSSMMLTILLIFILVVCYFWSLRYYYQLCYCGCCYLVVWFCCCMKIFTHLQFISFYANQPRRNNTLNSRIYTKIGLRNVPGPSTPPKTLAFILVHESSLLNNKRLSKP